MSWKHGQFYWNELMTRNVEGAKKFYGETLGWKFDAMPTPGSTYWIAKLGGESVGGLFDITLLEDMQDKLVRLPAKLMGSRPKEIGPQDRTRVGE